jgi:hypothetical protein
MRSLISICYSSDQRVARLFCLCLWLPVGSVLAAAAALAAARADAVLSLTAG